MPTKRRGGRKNAATHADRAALRAARKVSQTIVSAAMARRPTHGLTRASLANSDREDAVAAPPVLDQRFIEAAGVRELGTLVAEGDSWFDYFWFDILNKLDKIGYEIEQVAKAGDWVEDMAYSGGQLDAFRRLIDKLLRHGIEPKAILLSGGGNDVAGELAFLLNHSVSPSPGPVEALVHSVIDVRLRDAYLTILLSVTQLCKKQTGHAIPIIVHGYARPRPDGRGVAGGAGPLPGPWLRPRFAHKGFDDEDANTLVMAALIDRFNDMLVRITSLPELAHVRYVDLRPLLPNAKATYKTWWANELHPTGRGFEAIASKIAELI